MNNRSSLKIKLKSNICMSNDIWEIYRSLKKESTIHNKNISKNEQLESSNLLSLRSKNVDEQRNTPKKLQAENKVSEMDSKTTIKRQKPTLSQQVSISKFTIYSIPQTSTSERDKQINILRSQNSLLHNILGLMTTKYSSSLLMF